VVMGNAFVGLVHPCKIYNLLAVGAPILYLGPRPSHLTEILDQVGPPHCWTAAGHGEVDRVVRSVAWARQQVRDEQREAAAIAREFARERLLPQLVAEVAGRK